ncbi:MAG: hypothetical protein NZZ60_07345 [Bacteroidia bacterium]|nr:hypothetical protein [Bacteroidia bacterium]MCX7651901.1 hypothetical protein [Bacteroidia bacterium]MDW8416052.1 hypothetical protein [Bacteroidia bacterium]
MRFLPHGLQAILRFYPFQLPLYQFRRHLFLSLLWVILWLIALGQIGRSFGVSDIFYTPATGLYPTFASTFAWGIAYGIFVIAYHLTTYLLDGHHAGFLLREKHPFLLYAINNSLLPLSFWLFYLHIYTQQHHQDPNFGAQILGHATGTLGITTALLIGLDKFSGDIFQLRRLGLLPPQRVYMDVTKARATAAETHYYLTLHRGIQSSADYILTDKKALTKLLLRHHRNAFMVEIGLIVLISIWGYIQTLSGVYLPAAAAFLIFWAILYMLLGAVSFWIRKWGGWALLALGGVLVLLIYQGSLWESYSAYGLRYTASPMDTVRSPSEDSLDLITCLEAWHKKQGSKAPLVWVQVSGGGWRSAFWTLVNLQYLDSLSKGLLWQRCFAISGASGGLIGAATWRELGLFYPKRRFDLSEAYFLTQDALNPILSTAVTSFFSPTSRFQDRISREKHPMTREYAFEQALIRNSRAFGERRVGDYKGFEQRSQCPLLFITPVLIPTGRQLLISSQSCGILLRQGYIQELRQLTPDADHLRLTTALRMNASFPFILPPVRLPTAQKLEAVDAGAMDNFGEIIALRFLWNLRAAIAKYASRVILIEIRDLPPEAPTELQERSSALQDFIRRLGGFYTSFTGARQILSRLSYEVLGANFPIPVEKYTLACRPRSGRIPPLGFTLHPTDQAVMLNTLTDSVHIGQLERIIQAMK